MADDFYKPKPISHPSGHLYTESSGPEFDKHNVPQSKKSKGCFFYGCLSLIILSAVGGIAAYFAVQSVVGNLVDEYSESQAMMMPRVEASEEETKELGLRFGKFIESVETSGDIKEIRLTSREVNILLQSDTDLGDALNGKLYVELEGDQIKGQVSFPLETVGFDGRYLNGKGVFKLSLKEISAGETELLATIEKLSINGTPVPDEVLTQLKDQNLAEQLQAQTDFMEITDNLESLVVEDGILIIKVK